MTDRLAYARADEMASAYAERAATVLADDLVGIYLVGSYALDDLQAESDVDFMTVTSADLSPEAVQELRTFHEWTAEMDTGRPFEGFYVHEEDLRSHPDRPRHSRRRFLGGEFDDKVGGLLIEWETLRRYGHRVTGCPVDDLRVFDASGDVPVFSRRNLEEYWTPWLERTGSKVLGVPAIGPRRARAAWAVAWCVLGIPRLYVAITEGEIVSKTEAGVRARSAFDKRWHGLIDAALAYRREPSRTNVKKLASMRADALAFSRHVLDVAR